MCKRLLNFSQIRHGLSPTILLHHQAIEVQRSGERPSAPARGGNLVDINLQLVVLEPASHWREMQGAESLDLWLNNVTLAQIKTKRN